MTTEPACAVPYGMTEEEEYQRDLDEAIEQDVLLARLYAGRDAILPHNPIEEDTDDYPFADIH